MLRPAALLCLCCGLLSAGAGLVAGCATADPARLDIPVVLENPQAHRNERIELSGYVIDYEPARGDTYRTLVFTLGGESGEKILVSAAGYSAEAIAKASILVREAYEASATITVTGKLTVAKNDESAVPELSLRTIEYGGQKIDVTKGHRTKPRFNIGVGVGVGFIH
jgi:hypothetical protein